ncbi:hypothetical protein ACJX0J_020453, partial [Zea mays]
VLSTWQMILVNIICQYSCYKYYMGTDGMRGWFKDVEILLGIHKTNTNEVVVDVGDIIAVSLFLITSHIKFFAGRPNSHFLTISHGLSSMDLVLLSMTFLYHVDC